MCEEFLTVNEFAKLIKTNKKYVLNMIHEGKILAFRLSNAPNSRWRIKASEVERLISYELHKRTEKKCHEIN